LALQSPKKQNRQTPIAKIATTAHPPKQDGGLKASVTKAKHLRPWNAAVGFNSEDARRDQTAAHGRQSLAKGVRAENDSRLHCITVACVPATARRLRRAEECVDRLQIKRYIASSFDGRVAWLGRRRIWCSRSYSERAN
jgi:hypothetical protein